MLKYIVLFVLGLFFLAAQASDVTIQPRFTNSFRFTSTDVWNIDVQFTGTGNLNAYMVATITAGGRPVCTVKSGTVLLTPGAQSFTNATINTAQLNYQSQAIADIESITGTYPSGNYKICYLAYCVTANCDGLGANALFNEYPQCFEMVVEPPTPLLLAFPEDKAELEWKRPTFNWIAPMPLGSVAGFNYEYILVERDKNQTCPDAITRNRPMYKQSGIDQPTLPYPAELNDLDTGKVYCWKVNGLVEDIPVAQSEVWEFRLKKEEIKKKKRVIVKMNYLGQESPLPYLVHFDDTLVVQFTQEYFGITEGWHISLEPMDKSKNIDLNDDALTAKFNGTGEILFNAEDLPKVHANKVYVIKIFSEKNEVFAARILFKNE